MFWSAFGISFGVHCVAEGLVRSAYVGSYNPGLNRLLRFAAVILPGCLEYLYKNRKMYNDIINSEEYILLKAARDEARERGPAHTDLYNKYPDLYLEGDIGVKLPTIRMLLFYKNMDTNERLFYAFYEAVKCAKSMGLFGDRMYYTYDSDLIKKLNSAIIAFNFLNTPNQGGSFLELYVAAVNIDDQEELYQYCHKSPDDKKKDFLQTYLPKLSEMRYELTRRGINIPGEFKTREFNSGIQKLSSEYDYKHLCFIGKIVDKCGDAAFSSIIACSLIGGVCAQAFASGDTKVGMISGLAMVAFDFFNISIASIAVENGFIKSKVIDAVQETLRK